MKDLFPLRRPHTAGSEAIGGAVRASREAVRLLKARSSRSVDARKQNSANSGASPVQPVDRAIEPALFASVELPRPPERPPPPASLIDDSGALWAALLAKHAPDGGHRDAIGLASEKHEYKELYTLALANRSSKRVNAALAAHAEPPQPTYDFSGGGVLGRVTLPPILRRGAGCSCGDDCDGAAAGPQGEGEAHAEAQQQPARRRRAPISGFTNAYGMAAEAVEPPVVAPVPLLDMGGRGARGGRRPGGAGSARGARRPPASGPAAAAAARPSASAPASGTPQSPSTPTPTPPGADADDDAPAAQPPTGAAPGPKRQHPGRRVVPVADGGGAALSDAALAPVAARLNGELSRIQEQLLAGDKLSSALRGSLAALRRGPRAPHRPDADGGGSAVGAGSESVSGATPASTASATAGGAAAAGAATTPATTADRRRALPSKRAAVSVDRGRLRVGSTRLSADRTAELHALQALQPGLATACVAILRNTQIHGGLVRRASVHFHAAADAQDAAAANAVERRRHEHFLERPHRDNALSEVLSIHSMRAHVHARVVAELQQAAAAACGAEEVEETDALQAGDGVQDFSSSTSNQRTPRRRADSIEPPSAAGGDADAATDGVFLTAVPEGNSPRVLRAPRRGHNRNASMVAVDSIGASVDDGGSAGSVGRRGATTAATTTVSASGGSPAQPAAPAPAPAPPPLAHAPMLSQSQRGVGGGSSRRRPFTASSARGGGAAPSSSQQSQQLQQQQRQPQRRPQTVPLHRQQRQRRLRIDDIDDVNASAAAAAAAAATAAGAPPPPPPPPADAGVRRAIHKTISADIRPGAGSAAQVMLAMRLRAQLDALRTLAGTYDALDAALAALRREHRFVGLTCVHRRFLGVAHAAAVCEVVLDAVSLRSLAAQLHASVAGIPFLEAMKDTEVCLGDLDDAARYLRSSAPPVAAAAAAAHAEPQAAQQGVPVPTSPPQPPPPLEGGADGALFDDFAELQALVVNVAGGSGGDGDDEDGDAEPPSSAASAVGAPGSATTRGASGGNISMAHLERAVSAALLLRSRSYHAGVPPPSSVAAVTAAGGGGTSPAPGAAAASSPPSPTTPHSPSPPPPVGPTTSVEIPPSVLAKAEDFAAERVRRSWPALLRGPLGVLRAHAGWDDASYADWLRVRGLEPRGAL